MKRQYKYKREHFATQAEYEHFKKRMTDAQKKWLKKREDVNPEFRERRLLRQRLYSRYYWRTNGRQSFADWLREKYSICNLRLVSIDDLRALASKS